MFASAGILEHLTRGLIGLGAFWVTSAWSEAHPWLPFITLPLALLALRGCPMCWLVGLAETLVAKVRGRQVERTCIDGSCARRAPPEVYGRPRP